MITSSMLTWNWRGCSRTWLGSSKWVVTPVHKTVHGLKYWIPIRCRVGRYPYKEMISDCCRSYCRYTKRSELMRNPESRLVWASLSSSLALPRDLCVPSQVLEMIFWERRVIHTRWRVFGRRARCSVALRPGFFFLFFFLFGRICES